MSKFPWGKVIDYLQFDFEGDKVEVIKYHPHVVTSGFVVRDEYIDAIIYHIEELHSSYNTVQAAIIAYIAHKSLGSNQHMLVSGICRALDIKE